MPAPVRQVARDLVDKKLWPIAVLLLAALVAVPLLIGGSSSSAGAPPAPVGAVAPAPGSGSLVTAVDRAVTGKERPGDINDPIYDPPAPAKPAAASTTAAGTTAGTASSKPAALAGNPAAPAGPGVSTPTTPPAPYATPAPSVTPGVHHRTVARWYVDGADKPRALSRLTPLGPIEEPAALYLGVTRSESTNYAVFLLGSHSTSEGDGKCEDDECRVVGLKAGDKRTVSYALASGERRYQLEVTAVRTVTTDAAEARRMRARVHPDGRGIMRAMWQDEAIAAALERVRYDRDSGLLYKVRDAEKAAE